MFCLAVRVCVCTVVCVGPDTCLIYTSWITNVLSPCLIVRSFIQVNTTDFCCISISHFSLSFRENWDTESMMQFLLLSSKSVNEFRLTVLCALFTLKFVDKLLLHYNPCCPNRTLCKVAYHTKYCHLRKELTCLSFASTNLFYSIIDVIYILYNGYKQYSNSLLYVSTVASLSEQ